MVGENAGVDQRCKSTVATRGADSDQVLVCSPAAIVRSWPEADKSCLRNGCINPFGVHACCAAFILAAPHR